MMFTTFTRSPSCVHKVHFVNIMHMNMEDNLMKDIFEILKDRADATPTTKGGHFAEMDERELIAALGIKHAHVSKDGIRTSILKLVEMGQISLEPGDSGFPNYDKRWGGANYAYRYHILVDNIGRKQLKPTEKRNSDEREPFVTKGKKRVYLPRFPRTEWAHVSIKFINDGDILLGDNRDRKPSSFESLGCADERNDTPDDAWKFLVSLAIGGGILKTPNKRDREKIKKQKQKMTDILRKIFDNDTDPFERARGGIYKAKFSIEYHQIKEVAATDSRYADSGEFFSEKTMPREEV